MRDDLPLSLNGFSIKKLLDSTNCSPENRKNTNYTKDNKVLITVYVSVQCKLVQFSRLNLKVNFFVKRNDTLSGIK